MGTALENGALWGAHAKTWTEQQEPFVAPLWRTMLDAAHVAQGTRVLDVGCGGGGALRLAHERGATVTGLDASEALLDIAAGAVPGTFVAGEMEALPFDAASFDAVLATNALQYAADPVQAVRELVRVTVRGGRVVVGTWAEPEKNQMAAVFAAVRGAAPPPPGSPAPFDLARRDVLLDVLRRGGVAVERDLEVPCRFAYRDEAAYWAAQRSAGVMEGAARRIGESLLRAVVVAAAKPFTLPDGRIEFRNTMRCVVAMPA